MSAPVAVYSESLRARAVGESVRATVVRFADGTVRPLALERWMGPADAVDERVLAPLHGPVLDVGCGPGRHLHALAHRGVFGLGVDLSAVAVGLARGAGARAIVGSIFEDVPGAGRWRSALLLDGNIGIGGQPGRLLRRVTDLLAPGAQTLVELAPPKAPTLQAVVRLETARTVSDWFDWAQVSATDIAAVGHSAGLRVARLWSEDGRWFALLGPSASPGPTSASPGPTSASPGGATRRARRGAARAPDACRPVASSGPVGR